MINQELIRLMKCFPRSFVNCNYELIVHEAVNEYFRVDVDHEIELKYKVLEWLSRAASKTEPFKSKKRNEEFSSFMLNGINQYLGTEFTTEDMRIIYQQLGNNANRELTIKFVKSVYDMEILNQEEKING